MSSSATTSATSASPEIADQNSADQRLTTKRKIINANETDARKKAKIKLNNDSQQENGKLKFKKGYWFSYNYYKYKGDEYPDFDNPRDFFVYDDYDAHEPQIVWDEIKDAKQTILNDILTHLSEGKSLTIKNWSDDWDIPLFMHEYNVGLMSAQQIYESKDFIHLYPFSRENLRSNSDSLEIVECTAEPFLGCYIICDGRRGGGRLLGANGKINKMASHFLKNQVYGGKIYGNIILTRVTPKLGKRRPAYNETDRSRVPEMPQWMKDYIKRYGL